MTAGAPSDLKDVSVTSDEFFERVRRGYDALAAQAPGRIRRIDASRSIEAVFEDVRAAVDEALA